MVLVYTIGSWEYFKIFIVVFKASVIKLDCDIPYEGYHDSIFWF